MSSRGLARDVVRAELPQRQPAVMANPAATWYFPAMALPGTSRTITVDAANYRWMAAPNDEPGVAVVVQSASGRGAKLRVWVEHGRIITPALVAQIVRGGKLHGWAPDAPGPSVTLQLSDPDEQAEHVVLVPVRPWYG